MGPMLYAFIAVLEILTLFVSGLSCVYCGFKFTELGSNSNFDMGGFELTTDVGSYLELSQTWMVFLIISGITLLIILLLLCFMFTRIKIAIELIEEGSIAVGHMMSTLFFPFIPFVMEVIFVAWFFTVAAFLSSWNEAVRTFKLGPAEYMGSVVFVLINPIAMTTSIGSPHLMKIENIPLGL